MVNATRIWSFLALSLVGVVVVALTAWAFAAHLHPDRVGDFASFLQMCAAVLGR